LWSNHQITTAPTTTETLLPSTIAIISHLPHRSNDQSQNHHQQYLNQSAGTNKDKSTRTCFACDHMLGLLGVAAFPRPILRAAPVLCRLHPVAFRAIPRGICRPTSSRAFTTSATRITTPHNTQPSIPMSESSDTPRAVKDAVKELITTEPSTDNRVPVDSAEVARKMTWYMKRVGADDILDRLPPIVHVAGTKGKGSTCAFVESVLREMGLKTGMSLI
jgi:hypothetical protein